MGLIAAIYALTECRGRPPHGVARVPGVLLSDQVGEVASAVPHSADLVRGGDPGRLGETGRAVFLPRVLSQRRKDRVERVGGAHARRVARPQSPPLVKIELVDPRRESDGRSAEISQNDPSRRRRSAR